MYFGSVLFRKSVDIVGRVTGSSETRWDGGIVVLVVRLDGGVESEVSLQAVISIQGVQFAVG